VDVGPGLVLAVVDVEFSRDSHNLNCGRTDETRSSGNALNQVIKVPHLPLPPEE
jgi:hypothetical protein